MMCLCMEQHKKEHVKNLLRSCFKEASLTLNKKKCVFSKKSIKFLGQLVRIKPDPDINNMLQPTNITELRRFLGMVKQLNKFSPNLADHMKPLRMIFSAVKTNGCGVKAKTRS